MTDVLCFEFGDELREAPGKVTVEDLSRFLGHVQMVVSTYQEVVREPPGGLTAEQALSASTSVGSRRILSHSHIREELDALVLRRHEQTSTTGPVSLADLTAMTLAVKRRFGVRAGLSGSVELASAVLKRLFPTSFTATGTGRTRATDSGRAEDHLVPGLQWRPASSAKDVVEALRQAGHGGVTALWAHEVQTTGEGGSGEVTLYVHLGPDEVTGHMRIALVDPRAPQPVEVLSEQEWTASPGNVEWTTARLKTQMIVLDRWGRPVGTAAAASGLSKPTAAADTTDMRHPPESADAVIAANHRGTQPLPMSMDLETGPPAAIDTTGTANTRAVTDISGSSHIMGSADVATSEDTATGAERHADTVRAASPDSAAHGEANTSSQTVPLQDDIPTRNEPVAFLDARPRKNTAPAPRPSQPQFAAVRTRRSAQPSFRPVPAAPDDLRKAVSDVVKEITAADANRQISARTELENCVELAEGMLTRLFPGGIRVPRTRDDLSLSDGKIHDRLVPGAPWSLLTSFKDLIEALGEAGPNSVAVLLEQSQQDKGHVTLYIHAGLVPDTQTPNILRIDPQSGNSVQPLTENQLSRYSSERWVHSGPGTRMLVINGIERTSDGTGLTADPVSNTPQSRSIPHALSIPPTSTNYGAIGWEIEFSDQPITTIDNSELKYGTKLATNISGIELIVDRTSHYHFAGRAYATEIAAREAAARKDAPKEDIYLEKVPILELVSPPYQVTDSEQGRYPDWLAGFSDYSKIRQQLRLPGKKRREIPLTELFPRSAGWIHQPEAANVLVHPNRGGDDPSYYTQITIGAGMAGASFFLAVVRDRLTEEKAAFHAMQETSDFAAEITAAFATRRLKRLDRPVHPAELPFLFAVVPDLLQMHAYTWLMFNHASAIPLRNRFFKILTKNMLPAALRNPFYKTRRTLSAAVRSFLVEEEQFITERFKHYLLNAFNLLAKKWHPMPGAADIMDDVSHQGVKVRTYLDSMIRGGNKVGQYETVAMDDYEELDSVNGELPLALFELRLLDEPMTDAAIKQNVRWIRDLTAKAHTVALRSKSRDVVPLEIVNRLASHHSIVEMRDVLSALSSLSVTNAFNQRMPLISHYEYLTIAYTFTDYVVYGWKFPPDMIRYLETASTRLDKSLAPGARTAPEHRQMYEPIAARLRAILPTLPAAAEVNHVVPRGPVVGGPVSDSDVLAGSGVGLGRMPAVVAVVGWGVVRAGAVVRRAEGVWMDPVSRPVG
ncbi:hypothetical protein, partial [Streptomyces kaempferi]